MADELLWNRFSKLPLSSKEKGRIYAQIRNEDLTVLKNILPDYLEDEAVAKFEADTRTSASTTNRCAYWCTIISFLSLSFLAAHAALKIVELRVKTSCPFVKRRLCIKVWVVTDGGQYQYQFVGQCYVLQVCSFKKSNSHEFRKTPDLQILYHPVWTEDEMLGYVDKCEEHNIKTVNKESIRKLFPVFGGVPRYILQPKVRTAKIAKDNEIKEAGPEAMQVEGVSDERVDVVLELAQTDNESIVAGPEAIQVKGVTDERVDEELAQTDNESIMAGPEAIQVEGDTDEKVDEELAQTDNESIVAGPEAMQVDVDIYKAGTELIDSAITSFCGNASLLLEILKGLYVEDVSDKLVHCTTQDRLSRTMVFASDYAKEQMFTFLMRQDKIDFRKWLEDYQDDTAVGSLWGGLFETFAHQVLCKGGTFKMHNLHNRSEEYLRMNSSMKKVNFSNATDLVGLDKESAYGNAGKGFTCIDSLFFEPGEPPVFFQVFKSQKGEAHGFVFCMLQNIDEARSAGSRTEAV